MLNTLSKIEQAIITTQFQLSNCKKKFKKNKKLKIINSVYMN